MNSRKIATNNNSKWGRYSDMRARFELGLSSCRKIAKEAGAVRRLGRSVLIDMEAVDRYIDEQLKGDNS